MEPINSATEWSCGLAVLESIARSQDQSFDQMGFIQRYKDHFPAWQNMPGILSLNISLVGRLWMVRWELYDIARELGLAGRLGYLPEPLSLARHLAGPRHSAVAILQHFREEPGAEPRNHAVRITACSSDGAELMNPGRSLPGRVEGVSWSQFSAWEPFVFGLSPGSEPAEPSLELEPKPFQA